MSQMTIDVPETRKSIVKKQFHSLRYDANGFLVEIEVLDEDGDIVRIENVYGGGGAETLALITALNTPAPGETGGAVRRHNYRLHKFLKDGGYLTGVTVTP